MTKTLILMFHPDLDRSKANAALARAAQTIETVEMIDMAAVYPERRFDIMSEAAIEAQRLLQADRIVLQFPLQWYSVPGFMKDWIDAVLFRMYYIRPQEGSQLRGTPLMVAVTTGADAKALSVDGRVGFSFEQLLAPLEAMARRCGLPWHAPFAVHGMNDVSDALVEQGAVDYQAALRRFISATPARHAAEAA